MPYPNRVHPGGHYLLEGVDGTGKTTVLQALLPFSESGIAHLYVDVREDGNVGANL